MTGFASQSDIPTEAPKKIPVKSLYLILFLFALGHVRIQRNIPSPIYYDRPKCHFWIFVSSYHISKKMNWASILTLELSGFATNIICHELIEVPWSLLKPLYLTSLLLLRQTVCNMLILTSIKVVKYPVRLSSLIWLAPSGLCVSENM
jgi:hypothetical protein